MFSDDDDPCQNLRELLQPTLLRRTSQNQSELSVSYKSVTLALSALEGLEYDEILLKVRSDMDLIVSTDSTGQKYKKLFALILRLRIFCDLGDSGKGTNTPFSYSDGLQARSPVESNMGSELGCDVCQNDESLDLLKDRHFCPSCSRLLELPTRDSIASWTERAWDMEIDPPQTSYKGDTPQIAIRRPIELQERVRQFQNPLNIKNTTIEVYPTKLLAVADHLLQSSCHSKRSVKLCP